MYSRSKASASPYLIWMVLFTVLPLALVVYFAFTDQAGNPTLSNITALGGYAMVFVLSLALAAIATALCLVIAYPVSYLLSRLRAGQQGILLMLVMLPMWMNFLLRTYAWMSLLERNGLINRFLGLFGIGPFEMINTNGAIVLGMVYNFLPYMILPLYNAMLKIDKNVIEAAEDLGAGTLYKFSRVVLPLSKPGIRTGLIMVFVPSVSTFIISKMLGGGDTWLIGDLIEAQFLGNTYNYNLGSAMSLVLMVVVLLIMSVMGGFDSEDMEGVI
ncbi:ABC transporter permease [Ruminococcaceae bacterium OttesenSCG-928-I18]|nr:ABC transporter permease [Ruminococcaceae bacterium OttesenSCG-928-I18]